MQLRTDTTLGEEWADYLKGVIPSNAPDVQVQECKLAFYAGAYVMFGLVSNASAEAPDEDTGARRLEAIRQECMDHFTNFGRRHGGVIGNR
jgi:hypothetical protein